MNTTTLARRLATRASAAAALAACSLAQAHPGHGEHDSLGLLATLLHPLTLQQLPALALAVVVVLAAGARLARSAPAARRPLALLLVAGATLAGLAMLGRG